MQYCKNTTLDCRLEFPGQLVLASPPPWPQPHPLVRASPPPCAAETSLPWPARCRASLHWLPADGPLWGRGLAEPGLLTQPALEVWGSSVFCWIRRPVEPAAAGADVEAACAAAGLSGCLRHLHRHLLPVYLLGTLSALHRNAASEHPAVLSDGNMAHF